MIGEKEGLYNITLPSGIKTVYCENNKYGKKYTVIARRRDGSENFYRNMKDYISGFGNPSNEFFIGLQSLYELTHDYAYELLCVMTTFENKTRYARYSRFIVDSEDSSFRMLSLGGFEGDAGDALTHSLGKAFSTFDEDKDSRKDISCVNHTAGAFWHGDCALA